MFPIPDGSLPAVQEQCPRLGRHGSSNIRIQDPPAKRLPMPALKFPGCRLFASQQFALGCVARPMVQILNRPNGTGHRPSADTGTWS